MKTQYIKQSWYILLFFFLVYGSVSLVDHFNYRTSAWDLGIKNQEIYHYAHFQWNHNTVLRQPIPNKLGDHFSLTPLIVSPLYWIFGSYTLLVFQILMILVGGLGIYAYTRHKTENSIHARLIMLFFFCIWGIYTALAFDYHDNVPAAMLLPWFFVYADKKQWGWAALFLFLILICKENMGLWMFFVCLGIMAGRYKDRSYLKPMAVMALISLFYFVLVLEVIIPWINGDEWNYHHFSYSALGEDIPSVLKTILTKPWIPVKLLFENHLGNPGYNGIKAELHLVVLFSGGLALIYRPYYLIMLIPVYAQKLFNDSPTRWGVGAHYSIEFVPILALAVTDSIIRLRSSLKWKYLLIILQIIAAGATTVSLIESRQDPWYQPVSERFYNIKHYRSDFNRKDVRKGLSMIPRDASVTAPSNIVPHIAFRDSIFMFNKGIDRVQYLVFLPANRNLWPYTYREWSFYKARAFHSGCYEPVFLDNDILVFERINTIPEEWKYKSADLEAEPSFHISFDDSVRHFEYGAFAAELTYDDSKLVLTDTTLNSVYRLEPSRNQKVMVLSGIKPADYLRFKVIAKGPEGDGRLLFTGNKEYPMWWLDCQISAGNQSGWHEVYYDLFIPYNYRGNNLRVHFLNDSDQEIYFDNLQIGSIFLSSR